MYGFVGLSRYQYLAAYHRAYVRGVKVTLALDVPRPDCAHPRIQYH